MDSILYLFLTVLTIWLIYMIKFLHRSNPFAAKCDKCKCIPKEIYSSGKGYLFCYKCFINEVEKGNIKEEDVK